MTHAQFSTTKDLFTALKEKGVEWQPETELVIIPEGRVLIDSLEIVTESIPEALPALNALHLLELVQLVFVGVENPEWSKFDQWRKRARARKMSDDLVNELAVNDLRTVDVMLLEKPQTQAAVLIRRYFESGKVLSDLDECFLDFIKEVKAL